MFYYFQTIPTFGPRGMVVVACVLYHFADLITQQIVVTVLSTVALALILISLKRGERV